MLPNSWQYPFEAWKRERDKEKKVVIDTKVTEEGNKNSSALKFPRKCPLFFLVEVCL
jgi:hypothetical protein